MLRVFAASTFRKRESSITKLSRARLARLAQDRGCTMKVASRVVGFRNVAGRMVLQTYADEIRCKALVNCGGLQSDRVARLCGVDPGVRIVPFRGEYYELIASTTVSGEEPDLSRTRSHVSRFWEFTSRA